MTVNVGRKHWIVFGILLATQVFGMWATAHRNPMNVNPDWIYFGLFAVPKHFFGWMIAAEMTVSLCFVTALIIVNLWDAVRKANK